jgi:hypothetical protein
MIEYFEYYQLHLTDGKIITGLTEEEAKIRRESGLSPEEFLVGPYTGMRNKEDEKEQA